MFKKPLFWILIFIVLAPVGGGYYYYRQSTSTAKAANSTPLQTATVKRGNLVISASGTGSVISKSEIPLGFDYSGVLAQLNVVVGDEVKQGDVLAISAPADDASTIKSKLTSARLSVLQAKQNLDNLSTSAATDVNLAQLQSDFAAKQVSVYASQSTLTNLINA